MKVLLYLKAIQTCIFKGPRLYHPTSIKWNNLKIKIVKCFSYFLNTLDGLFF